MSANNQLIICRAGKIFGVYENLCVDNPWEKNEEDLIKKLKTLDKAILFANEYCKENLVEYGYTISEECYK